MTEAQLRSKLDIIRAQGCNEVVINFILLQMWSGARISDLLRVRRSDITQNLYVNIRQCKGSLPLVVKLSDNCEFWQQYRSGAFTDISGFNKNYFYRLYKRFNIQIYNGVGRNSSVTHVFRKELANEVFAASGEIVSAQSALGHKSSSSTMYYLNDQNKRAALVQGLGSSVSGTVNNLVFSNRKTGCVVRLSKK